MSPSSVHSDGNLANGKVLKESVPSLNFNYPAETCRHIATILGFPSECSAPSMHYENACREIIDLAATISEFESVRLYARPEDSQRAQTMLNDKTHGPFAVEIIPFATNHLWVRDTAPVYVHGTTPETQTQRFAVNFRFNEWGGSVSDNGSLKPEEQWPKVDAMQLKENATFAKRVIQQDASPSPVTCIESQIRLEGGALVYDGEGTLIASESSIIGEDRNPGMSKLEIEAELRRLLGATRIIWFPGFKNLDITDVHSDAELQFIRPGVLVMSRPHESAEERWHEVYEQVKAAVEGNTDAKGRTFEVHELPEPDPKVTEYLKHEDPATNYVNFYFANGAVILPKFGDDETDTAALRKMQELCPDRVVKQVYVNALPLTGGVIHCSTQPVVDLTNV
ncbi:porphyromonas-type peptidyl-arginine deiminase superfamily [Pochonia chlamydosporia 170]|uniref:Porphyromonas-type peptidyl-arginine deiminase superfamily n=1 Tax=Pochonia chlamydosporia 170 TaxID=1380566 RepID=A0A179G9A2_METCM|nr:porphyromonas-type peptidyl-arginine deiminase superfamily [Pochonia chlamydosporia 170]OAQ74098.1 porphyromonas-type peptidyl-arginine deiminase superfamily [Pochonia chlamydosporia 170]